MPQVRLSSIFLVIFLAVCAATESVLGEEAGAMPGIVFVGGSVIDGEFSGMAGSYHWRDGYVYPKGATNNAWERTISAPRPGRNLFALSPATPDGELTQLTFLKEGNVFDPEPSFDGKKVLFSMRKDNEDWFHLFEIGIDGTDLRQLTDGPFNDVSGVYLPDGRIVFCSDRSGVLDEYHEERSEFLFRMNADGTEIKQLTFVPGIYFEPTVLQNGMLVCSFWDAFHISVPPFIKHETYLITLRPDGTEERPLFGAGEHQFYNRTRHSSVGLTSPGELPDGRLLVQSEMGPSIYDPNLGMNLSQALTPIFPPMTSVQTGGTTHKAHLSPLGTRSTPYPLQDGQFLLAATLPGSRDLGIFVANPATRTLTAVFDRKNLSEWDPVPVGLPRPIPRQLPEKQRDQTSKFATFVVASGRRADKPERNELNQRARFVRVLQAEYTTVTTSSHTSLETRVLGTVPILPDGSIAFEAPAETPLFLETLDARGNRLVLQAGYMAAQAGEVKSCFGCHAPQSEAVPNPTLRALELPLVRVTRDRTDQSYRRNDPEEYRRHAIIGQSPKYREWLNHAHPEIRRAGLEQLAQLPDEVTGKDRERFVALLKDEAASVRQQAAFTLAMTGSAEQIPPLVDALRDPDWVVRHYSAMALEAITGLHRDLAADEQKAAAVWENWWKEVGSTESFLEKTLSIQREFEDVFDRDAWMEAVGRTRWIASYSVQKKMGDMQNQWREAVRQWLVHGESPDVAVVKAAGMLADPQAVPLITPWLIRGLKEQVRESEPDSIEALERETRGSALAEAAATALGRINSPDAIAALWSVLHETVPNRSPGGTRHYQTGPRHEEYTYLRALINAGATPSLDDVPDIIALLPYTEGEKPRFEDRTKIDSQRVWLGRILLNRMGKRAEVIQIAQNILRGKVDAANPVYQALLAGTNIDRPRSEHGRAFPVVTELGPEQALHLLACLAETADEVPEELIVPRLHSANHRDRIEAAVILRRFGFSKVAEKELLTEIRQPYAFREIFSIGKGRRDPNFRDKSYMMMALAAHADDVEGLMEFTDYQHWYRDIRIGLAIGLGFRAKPDAIPVLNRLAGDPIFSVYRLSEDALVEIRDAEFLAGRTFPDVQLPPRTPLKPEYAAPGDYEFADRTPSPTEIDVLSGFDRTSPDTAIAVLKAAVAPGGYQNVANTFARNAERMRISDANLLSETLQAPDVLATPASPELDTAVQAAIDSPYPFAHYLVARWISARNEKKWAPALAKKLPDFVNAADTVGFHSFATALGELRAEESADELANYATNAEHPKTFGPLGMAYGYSAARGLGLILAPDHETTQKLLHSKNVWIRTGVRDGLAERGLDAGEDAEDLLLEDLTASLDTRDSYYRPQTQYNKFIEAADEFHEKRRKEQRRERQAKMP